MDKTKETETRSSQGQKDNGHCLDILENDRDLGELGGRRSAGQYMAQHTSETGVYVRLSYKDASFEPNRVER